MKHDAAVQTAKEVQIFWEKASIPIRPFHHVVKKLKDLVQQFEALKKNKGRSSETQKKNEKEFKNIFDNLFDIAHQRALEMIKNEEDKEFLLAQREKGRRGSMGGIDLKLATKQINEEIREQKRAKWMEKQMNEVDLLNKSIVLEESSASEETDIDETSLVAAGPSTNSKRKRGRKNMLTSAVLSTLDRTKMSDRHQARSQDLKKGGAILKE